MLDIGISSYTNSRIRRNAELGGYTGYAEPKAANSYDMLSTRTDGGWMHFKTNNDDYVQLSGSDNKVNIYKDTSISSNLTINGDLGSSKKSPLDIQSSTSQTEFWTLAPFHQGIANSGSWLQFSRDGTSNTWQAGMSSDNSYVTRASDAPNRLIVNRNGDTLISGDLESQSLTINKPSHDDDIPFEVINNNRNWEVVSLESTSAGDGCLMRWMTPASSTHWWSGVRGTNTNEFNIRFNYNGLSL